MTMLKDTITHNARRSSCIQVLLLWICIMIPVSALLYGTSAAVREKENELANIAAQISAEKDSLRVLRAEWAFLNQPQKLSSRAQKYLTAKKAASAAQILAERNVTAKIAYRQSGSTMVASNVMPIMPSAHIPSTRILAKPIVFDDQALAALHTKDDVTLPSAVTWSQKIVSVFGLSDLQNKSRITP